MTEQLQLAVDGYVEANNRVDEIEGEIAKLNEQLQIARSERHVAETHLDDQFEFRTEETRVFQSSLTEDTVVVRTYVETSAQYAYDVVTRETAK